MDEKKKAYQEKIDARLAATRAELDKLRAQADEKKADAKIELNRRIEDIEQERKRLEDKAGEIKSASSAAWEDLKSGFSEALDRIGRSIEEARSKFK